MLQRGVCAAGAAAAPQRPQPKARAIIVKVVKEGDAPIGCDHRDRR
jgi:hypothetical protein